MFSFRRRTKGMLWLSSQCNHVSPINSRSPLKDATGCPRKNLLSLAIKSVRSLALEFPALLSNTQNSGMQTFLQTMPSINMLIWHRPNFQLVQSRAKCHGLPASPMIWTIRRAMSASSRRTYWKTLKTTVNGQGLRPCVNMPGKSPQADRSGLYNQRHQPNKRVSPCPPKHNVIF